MLEEATVQCPSCWEPIPLLIDLSGGSASYTEDCSVCCRPMLVHVVLGDDGDWDVHVAAEND